MKLIARADNDTSKIKKENYGQICLMNRDAKILNKANQENWGKASYSSWF
jgi:hypothetical protein